MISRAIALSVAAVSMATASVFAADLTERLMSERMTVVKVDRAHGRFLCAEHRHWTWISKQGAVEPGVVGGGAYFFAASASRPSMAPLNTG